MPSLPAATASLRRQQEYSAGTEVFVVLIKKEFVCGRKDVVHGQIRGQLHYALLDIGHTVVYVVGAVGIAGDEINVARSVTCQCVSRHPYRRKIPDALGSSLRVGQFVGGKWRNPICQPQFLALE